MLYGYPPVLQLITGAGRTSAVVRIRYRDGRGVLRQVLTTATRLKFSILDVDIDRPDREPTRTGEVELALSLSGTASAADLVTELSELAGVRSVAVDDEPGG